jgi:cation diffusion facilitator CzcD-associated flavoprotein CzcO
LTIETTTQITTPKHYKLIIVGSGFSGLGMAIRLKQNQINDFIILEKASTIGGTWRDNTYPGCACDVPSNLYSFSFELNPDWSHTFSPQTEIQQYLQRVAQKYNLADHTLCNQEVTKAQWDKENSLWRVTTDQDSYTANILIAAPGGLSEPKLPDIPGIESFKGKIFHSARWDHQQGLEDKRVAVIGTGASSIQIVPNIQPLVKSLNVYQRTAPWVVPRRDRKTFYLERLVYRKFPVVQKFVRACVYGVRELYVWPFMRPKKNSVIEKVAQAHLHHQVTDPILLKKLRPDYRIGCKRILISNDYYPALNMPNVNVIDSPIEKFTENGIVTADGYERELDVVILATGFHVTDMPVAEWLHDGEGRRLSEQWQGSPQAYLGTTVQGLPNLFLLIGPNTGLGHNSIIFMIETQVHYVLECLKFMEKEGIKSIEVRKEVEENFNRKLQKRLEGTVWNSGGCRSWYLDENGRNTTIWPGFTWPFRKRLRKLVSDDYVLY